MTPDAPDVAEMVEVQAWIDSLPSGDPISAQTIEPWIITVQPQTRVYWSVPATVMCWAPDDVRSMPIDRYTRYGYQGGRLGKRMRRERSAIAERLRRGGT